jgi:EmrB/QacA subfamily drug resistance transporter
MERKWWTLVGTCAGLFLLMLDSTVVALALPSIRGDVDASSAGLQWMMNGYLLAITVFVVTAGRLGDIFGRKRLFILGAAVFALGSLVSGAAGDEQALVLGRVLQGVGAAPMLPLSLAIVCNAFPQEEQARALGVWAGISAVALAIGPFVGGALVEVDWRLIFWINLPIAALAIAITAWAAPESTDPGAGRPVDLSGLAGRSFGHTAIVRARVQARGWSDGVVFVLVALGALALVGFWSNERRSPQPIVDFGLFRNGPYFGASAAAFALVGSYWCVMFFQAQYLQDVRGHSAVLSGLLILPVTFPMVFISPLSARLIARFGARRLMTAGMACAALGLAVLTQVDADSSYGLLLAGYLPFGVALGLVYAPMSTAAMAAMPPEKVGVASGVLAMDRVLAGTVALAAAGALTHALQEGGDGFAAAIAGANWLLVGLCTVGAALTWGFVRDLEPPRHDPRHRHSHV